MWERRRSGEDGRSAGLATAWNEERMRRRGAARADVSADNDRLPDKHDHDRDAEHVVPLAQQAVCGIVPVARRVERTENRGHKNTKSQQKR